MTTHVVRKRTYVFRPTGESAGYSSEFIMERDADLHPTGIQLFHMRGFENRSSARVWVESQNREEVNGVGFKFVHRYDVFEARGDCGADDMDALYPAPATPESA